MAQAVPNVEVDPGSVVTLDGSGSEAPDGERLTFAWSQVSGAAVALAGADTARATFDAPVEPGALTFRLTVTDPDDESDSVELTVTVRDLAPDFGGAAVSALALSEGEAMEPVVLPRATGGNGALVYSLASDPAGLAGLSFDAATRTLSGTPSASGRYAFALRADDADANMTETDAAVLRFEVTVRDLVPDFGGAAVAALALREGQAMDPMVLPRATGGNGALVYSLASDPAGLAGLSFDAATRTLSGTPSASGRYAFALRADDADANMAETDAAVLRFEVAVTVRDLAPDFGGATVAALALREGQAMDPMVLPGATGGNGALSYSLTSDPAGLAGLSFDAATRTLSGTPSASGALRVRPAGRRRGCQHGGDRRGGAALRGDDRVDSGSGPRAGGGEAGSEAHAGGAGDADADRSARQYRGAVRGRLPGFEPDAGRAVGAAECFRPGRRLHGGRRLARALRGRRA